MFKNNFKSITVYALFIILFLLIGFIYIYNYTNLIRITSYSNLKLERYSFGGVVGSGDGFDITISNDIIKYGTVTRTLTQNEKNKLIDYINKSGFFNEKDTPDSLCSDSFGTSLIITVDDKYAVRSFENGCSENITKLEEFDSYLVNLIRNG